jgi:hypothetical protein
MRLTRDEIILVTSIILALVTGAIVKNCRAQRRLATPAAAIPAEK